MGLVYTDLRLANIADSSLDEINACALVDSGALHLCIPKHLSIQLKLKKISQREVRTADGNSHVVDYVGPIQVSLMGRTCITGALVLGDEVLLGAIPMEDMDMVIIPSTQQIVPNPKNPNIPVSLAKLNVL